MNKPQEFYAKEYWTGDSRNGSLINGDGYHFYRITRPHGVILEAYESYEDESSQEIVTPLPDLKHKSWIKDFGFENFDLLEEIDEIEFLKRKNMSRPKIVI